MASPRRSVGHTSTSLQQSPITLYDQSSFGAPIDPHLAEIQLELELLKERRRALEQQRKLLLRSGSAAEGSSHAAGNHSSHAASASRSVSAGSHRHGPSNVSERSNRSVSRGADRNNRSTSALNQRQFIPSEKERREQSAHGIYHEMKEAMRRSWEGDSTLVGGFFGVRDNPRSGTFGRERRFSSLSGSRGQYHLATDVEVMQDNSKQRGRHLTASSRGRPGCNVQSNWNDSKGGAAPGPGAYTPRYQKVAKPSILASRML